MADLERFPIEVRPRFKRTRKPKYEGDIAIANRAIEIRNIDPQRPISPIIRELISDNNPSPFIDEDSTVRRIMDRVNNISRNIEK